MDIKVITLVLISVFVYMLYVIVEFILKNTTLIVNLHFNENRKYAKTQFRIAWYSHPPSWLPTTFNFSQCRFSNCELSDRKAKILTYDAIIFHYRSIKKLPLVKPYGQLWIVWTAESPVNEKPVPDKWDGLFDWSVTYSRQSEVQLQRSLRVRRMPLNRNYSEVFKKKQKLVAWVVSNCKTPSLREKYVRELKKYIPVDIFGSCNKSNLTVCKQINRTKCHIKLSNIYKFYLGFENSLCEDYITEKVYDNFLEENNMVYVVRSAPNITDLIPNGTFINTNDFQSPRKLAKFLLSLDKNEADYIKYLKEKDKYKMIDNRKGRALCSLCKLLNTRKERETGFSGRSFRRWFAASACIPPKDIPSWYTSVDNVFSNSFAPLT